MEEVIYDLLKLLLKPPSKKLLPDVVHPLYHPKTLVLNLSGTLIKTDYIFGKGQMIIRRPGLEKFLKHLSRKYEIIIFSYEENNFIQQSILTLDPQRMIFVSYFGKECMLLKNGSYIKDLRYLNRDLRKVIAIDTNV
jgi:TFIIF-interacting CTD phosphatase-like protein